MPDKFINVLTFGEQGCGKTWFALTFPAPMLFLDTENGAKMYESLHETHPGMAKFVRRKVYDLPGLREQLIEARSLAAKGQIKTVVIDTLTGIFYSMKDALTKGESRKMAMNEYDIFKTQWKALMLLIAQIECNVVINCHEKEMFHLEGKVPVKDGFQPDCDLSVLHVPDLVLRFYKEGGKRLAMIQPELKKEDRHHIFPVGKPFPVPGYKDLKLVKEPAPEPVEEEEEPPKPKMLITAEQWDEVERLAGTLNLKLEAVNKRCQNLYGSPLDQLSTGDAADLIAKMAERVKQPA